MPTYICDPDVERRVRAEREASGSDLRDEVWDGVYFMPPLANTKHQGLATRLAAIFAMVVRWPEEGAVYAGVNVSDREEGWTYNYRIPDVAVALRGGPVRDCKTHLCGGPDIAVEIVSPDDRSRDKLEFYSRIGVRELIVIDRDPWFLELYRNQSGELKLVGTSTPETSQELASDVLPLVLQLIAGEPRPHVAVRIPGHEKTLLA